MRLLKKRKILFWITLSGIGVIALFSSTALDSGWETFFRKYNGNYIEPIFFWFVGVFISTGFLLFFKQDIYELWFKKFAVWYVTVGFVLSMVTETGGGFSPGIDRMTVVTILNIILVLVTILFASVQYWKSKKVLK